MVMKRISVIEAAATLPALTREVNREGNPVELTEEGRVVARLTPPNGKPSLDASQLNDVFAQLPSLGDEEAAFARDIQDVRDATPLDRNRWG